MLEHLPTELQEKICGLLDGTSLLRASCVSKQWNRIISGLQVVWRELCMRNAFGTVAVDWKQQYLICRHLLQDIKKGKAFQHRNFAPKCFHSSDVRDVTYSNGYLVAAIQNIVRIWQTSDLKPIATFEMPYDVFRLNLSKDGCILVVGHYQGFITSWLLEKCEDGVKTNLLQEYIKHDDNVVCLSIHTESDLLCSGSHDRTVKLWRVTSGELLLSFPTDGWVAQVIIFNISKPSLIITDQSSVRLCSWQTFNTNSDLKIHQLDIPVDKKVSMRKLVVHDKNLMFVRNCTIVMLSLETLQELRSFSLECKDLVLLASGKRFMLVTLWEGCQKNSRLGVVDIFTGEIIGTYPMPFCREFVMVGDSEWLDALHETQQLVAIGWLMGIILGDELTDMLYLIKWA